jgi:hypothetical protein
VTEPIEELYGDPESNPSTSGLGPSADPEEKAPKAEADDECVQDKEPGTGDPGHKVVEEARWWKDFVESKDVLFD